MLGLGLSLTSPAVLQSAAGAPSGPGGVGSPMGLLLLLTYAS